MNRGVARRITRAAGLLLAAGALVGPRAASASEPTAEPTAPAESQPLTAWSPAQSPAPASAATAPAATTPVVPSPAASLPVAATSDRPVSLTRRGWSNPRALRRVSAGVVAFGPTPGLGLVAEYLPHWIAGFGFGVGGGVRLVSDGSLLGAGTLFTEIALLPVPFVVTPVLGAGFAVTLGPLADYLPGFAGSPPKRDEFLRLMPYGRLGLRVDLRRNIYLAGEIVLAPDNRFDQGGKTHPLPSLRLGFSVL